MEDAVASLGASKELTSIRFAGWLRLGDILVEFEGQVGGVDTSSCGDAQRQAGDWRVVNAGAKRVAHDAGEEPLPLAAGDPRNGRAPGRRRGGRAVEQRHGTPVEVVSQLERRLGAAGVTPAADRGDGRLVGSVVPERAGLLVRRDARGRGRGREQARQPPGDGRVAVVGASRGRGRRGRARSRAAGARFVLRRRVGGARRAGVHGYRRHGHGRRNPLRLSATKSICPTSNSER
jgi:hypothetical protein